MKKGIFSLIALLALAGQGFCGQITATAIEVGSYSGETYNHQAGYYNARVGLGGGIGYYHMLIRFNDIASQNITKACTLVLSQNLGVAEYATTISTVKGDWTKINSTSSDAPLEGGVCYALRVYSTTNPILWDDTNFGSTLEDASSGNNGSHINSVGLTLPPYVTGTATAAIDSVLLYDLKSGEFSGFRISKAADAPSTSIRFSVSGVKLRWDDSAEPITVHAEKSSLLTGPNGLSLGKNNPNPCHSSTIINYNTGSVGKGSFSIYNAQGKKVYSKTVSGQGAVAWNAKKECNGLYIYKLTVANTSLSGKLLLLK